MVLGILTIIGGSFVLYQAYSLWAIQSMFSTWIEGSGAFFICGLGMIISGALCIANENKKSPDYALRSAIISAATAVNCAANYYGDLQVWLFVNAVLAAIHFYTWYKLKKDLNAHKAQKQHNADVLFDVANENEIDESDAIADSPSILGGEYGVIKKLFVVLFAIVIFIGIVMMISDT